MRHILGIAILLLSGIGATAQNLVPNPGFELTDRCPQWWSEKQEDLTTTHWESPTTATPDNFSACSDLSGVPNNWVGVMPARTGTAYAGFIARRNFGRSTDDTKNPTHREYLQTKLNSTLEKGAEYKVTFYVALAENCRLASDGIGAHFSKAHIGSSSKVKFPYTAQVQYTKGVVKSATTWTEVEGLFIAKGDERYMTIGNFISNSGAAYEEVNYPIRNEGNPFPFSYYFVDDVQVIKTRDAQNIAPVSAAPTTTSQPSRTADRGAPPIATTIPPGTATTAPTAATSAGGHTGVRPEGTKPSGPIVKDFVCECNVCRADVKTVFYSAVHLMEIDSTNYRIGQRVLLSDVHFKTESDRLALAASQDELDLLVFLLKEMPSTEVELVIHMNALNNEVKNRELSKKTAATLYNYLRDNGVSNKILYNGFGHKIIPPKNGQRPDRTLEMIIRKI
jgi:outer membrane protein OmpA-like peptidoglycan-associated protein